MHTKRCADLLAGEGPAAALDELPGGGRLVGAVDVQGDSTLLVQIHHLESRGAQPGAGRLRARYRAAHAPGLCREGVDEEVHGAAGADADRDLAPRQFQRRQCCASLFGVGISRHRRPHKPHQLQKRLCPHRERAQFSRIRLGGHSRDRRVKAYFFFAAFFLAFFFAFAMLALQLTG